jgi:hypothetical protein|tara:strand:+ start:3190 stop:5007 length:1818 start_codon:yes stop_codon:yes gene_type:complete
MITNDNIEKFKSYGFVLTPVHKSKDPNIDKKPETPNGTWKYDWTDQELRDANRIGAYHTQSNIYDVDFDDKSFRAHQFIDMLPPTFTIGKKVNGRVIATHKIFKKPEDVKMKSYSYPRAANKGERIIELLSSTQTIIAGVDRVIIDDREPISLDPRHIEGDLRLIVAFSELLAHTKNIDQRNNFYFRLGGALASQTDVPMDQRIKYVEKLCELTNDNEVKNRISCIERQQEKYDAGEDVFGMKELSEFLNVNLKGFDEIKKSSEIEKREAKGLTFLNGNQFVCKDFPEPEYLLNPIVAKQQIRQVFAKAGTGKTLYCLHEAAAIASGYDFLNYKNVKKKKTPVLYVEGEMDSASIKNRLFAIQDAYEMQQKELDLNMFFFATLAIQDQMHFDSLTNEIGRQNVEITAQEIEKRTGQKPVIYLDNITALTVMQEKEGAEWVVMMQWLSKLRNKGYHVTFLHHPTKTGETASGSNIKERSIDIDMKLTTPDEKTMIEEYEENHTQMTISFLKWREHMNTHHSKERTAIINRTTGAWLLFPKLSKTQRKIYKMLQEGQSAMKIIEDAKKNKSEGMSKANVYKTIKLLEKEGLYEASGQTTDGAAKEIC